MSATTKQGNRKLATRGKNRPKKPLLEPLPKQGCISTGDFLLIASTYRPMSSEEIAAVESAKAEAMERSAR